MHVLVTNDDGIQAPGLLAVVNLLASFAGATVCVAAPRDERSATSHAITIRGPLVATPVAVPHAAEAYAISGTPADCTMLALASPLFAHRAPFDLVVSGINRGNNLGLHVVYSGTVAAAREAAAKGVPAVALSLDIPHHGADSPDFAPAAAAVAPLLARTIARIRAGDAALAALRGTVLNVNVPLMLLERMRGYALTSQGFECAQPDFQASAAVPADTVASSLGPSRAWHNRASGTRLDRRAGTDSAAVAAGQVAVTVVTLLSHAPPLGAAGAGPASHAACSSPQLEGFNDAAADAVLDAAAAAASAAGCGAAAFLDTAAPAES